MISKISTNVIFKYNFQESPVQTSDLSCKYSTPVGETKTNFLQKDTFQPRKKFNPSFGALPYDEVSKLCDDFLRETKHIYDSKKIEEIAKDFFYGKLFRLLDDDSKMTIEEQENFSRFRHTIVNQTFSIKEFFGSESTREIILKRYPNIITDSGYCSFCKMQIKSAVSTIKNCIFVGERIELYKVDNKAVPALDILNLLKKTISGNKSINISWHGKKNLKTKTCEDPIGLYNLLLQPLLNAIKYSEEKPFKIVIEEVEKNSKKIYYANFINPDTNKIPDKEIDKILEGTGHRAADTNIDGTGFGFTEIIRILRENGYEGDIPNLIQKGRKKGVCVRIPLIGIQ